jgi:hypothetical protein
MRHPAAPLRPCREQLAVGGQAADHVLRQLGPVDPNDQLLPAGREAGQGSGRCAHVGLRGTLAQCAGVHAERVHRDLSDPATVIDPAEAGHAPHHPRAEHRRTAVEERLRPALSEKPHVVGA